MAMLEIRDLNVYYGGIHALKGISLEVLEGQIVSMIGSNGAGKSTTLKALLGLVHPDAGEVTVLGKSFREEEQSIKERIGVVLGGIDFYPKKKVRLLSDVTRRFYGNWQEEKYRHYLNLFGIDQEKRVDQLSTGMRVKYMIALALSHDARLLILDEPTSQLDPIAASDFLQTLGRINRELGTTVLLTEHRLEEALPLATHAAVMDGGRLLSAVLLRLLRRETCWRVMRIIGTAAGALLVVGGVVGAVRRWQGSWSLAAAGCFLLYSAVSATTSTALMELRALMDRKIRMETRGKLPIQPMAMLSTRTLHHAVRALHPTRMTQLYIIEPGTMRLLGILTEQQLIAAYLSAPQRTLAEEVDA